MEIHVRLEGGEALTAKLAGLQALTMNQRLRALMEDVKNAYVLLAQRAVPVKTRFLRASIHGEVENFGTPELRVRVGTSAKYAPAIEEGGKPHIILPRNKRWLHWFEDAAGNTVEAVYGLAGTEGLNSQFRQIVSHPGNKAQPFFFRQLPIVRERMLQALGRILNEELSRK